MHGVAKHIDWQTIIIRLSKWMWASDVYVTSFLSLFCSIAVFVHILRVFFFEHLSRTEPRLLHVRRPVSVSHQPPTPEPIDDGTFVIPLLEVWDFTCERLRRFVRCRVLAGSEE